MEVFCSCLTLFRRSGVMLTIAFIQGIQSIPNVKFSDIDEATTPILHYMLVAHNNGRHETTQEEYTDEMASAVDRIFSSARVSCLKKFRFHYLH
jgi:hypothetical protein